LVSSFKFIIVEISFAVGPLEDAFIFSTSRDKILFTLLVQTKLDVGDVTGVATLFVARGLFDWGRVSVKVYESKVISRGEASAIRRSSHGVDVGTIHGPVPDSLARPSKGG
jgi:hypothetical protein